MTSPNSDTRKAAVDRYAVVKRQVSCNLCGDGVLLKGDDGRYYGLNHVGAFVWNLLQQSPTTLEELKSRVLAKYQVDPEQCEWDILNLLADLINEGLIEEAR